MLESVSLEPFGELSVEEKNGQREARYSGTIPRDIAVMLLDRYRAAQREGNIGLFLKDAT